MLCPRSRPHAQGSGTDGGRDAGVQGLLKHHVVREEVGGCAGLGRRVSDFTEEQLRGAHSRQASSSQIFQTNGLQGEVNACATRVFWAQGE